MIVLVVEHAMIGFKALVGLMMTNVPGWITRRIQRERYLEERDHEKIVSKFKVMSNVDRLKNDTGKTLRSMNNVFKEMNKKAKGKLTPFKKMIFGSELVQQMDSMSPEKLRKKSDAYGTALGVYEESRKK